MFAELNDEGKTVVVVTHDHETAGLLPRAIELADGRVVRDRGAPSARRIEVASA
jgi:ABC-type lipoprotein export system ATPase subunit